MNHNFCVLFDFDTLVSSVWVISAQTLAVFVRVVLLSMGVFAFGVVIEGPLLRGSLATTHCVENTVEKLLLRKRLKLTGLDSCSALKSTSSTESPA